MHALPVYASLSRKQYGIFEYLTGDWIPYSSPTIRGFTGGFLFGCKGCSKTFHYNAKRKSQFIAKLRQCIRENGKGRNPRAVDLRYLLTDYCTEAHGEEVTLFLVETNVQLLNSSPYKHEGNLSERFVQTTTNMARANMYYNKAPMNTY